MEAIKINHLTKKFGDRIVFENLNLEIPERSIISIVGKSGSGKSTLLNMIGLLEDFEIGSIELFGNTLPKINSSKATQIRRNKISYLFQSYALINDMTVTQNLLLSLHFTDLSTNEKKNKLDLVPLSHATCRKAASLLYAALSPSIE